jgi:hypothetical protein
MTLLRALQGGKEEGREEQGGDKIIAAPRKVSR